MILYRSMCARFARACKMFLIKNVYINLILFEEIVEKNVFEYIK